MLFDVIILASGAGKWTDGHASSVQKTLLKIDGETSLLYLTILRALALSPHRVIVISGKENIKNVESEVEKVKRSKEYLDLIEKQDIFFAVIKEPENRGNAPLAALGAYILDHPDNHNVTVLLSADQTISNDDYFTQTLKSAYSIAKKGYIVTLGVAPSRLTTNYSYIETANLKNKKWYTIKKYEKMPDIKTAENYVKNEKYYYNSGILVFRPVDMILELEKYAPKLAYQMERIKNTKLSDHSFNDILSKIFESLEPLSLEDSVLGKSKNSVLVPTRFKWNDLSAWTYMFEEQNTGVNESMSERVIYMSSLVGVGNNKIKEKQLKVLRADGFMMVDTNDALLVCDKDNAEDVRVLKTFLGNSKI